MILFSAVLLGIGTVLSIFYTASEIAIVSANRIRIGHYVRVGVPRARRVATAVEHPESYLTSSLIGNNLTISLVSIVATSLVRTLNWPQDDALKVVLFFGGSLLFLFFAEILPKAIVQLRPILFLMTMWKPIAWSRLLFAPAAFLVEAVTRKLVGERLSATRFTREELAALVKSHEARTIIPQPEEEMAHRLFAMHRVRIREVMTPRRRVVCIPHDAVCGDFLAAVRDSGFTRLPTYRQWGGRFTGLVNAFDLLYHDQHLETVAPLVRDVPAVGADELAWEVLVRFQGTPHRMAFVRDASGRHVGIVTVEDLIEEILGEIRDEFD